MKGPERKFDWEVARELREDGWTIRELAEWFGVSYNGVYLALNAKARRNLVQIKRRRQRSGICDECGSQCSHNPSARKARGLDPNEHLCHACASRRLADAYFLTRLSPDGLIRCSKCGEYKDMDGYRDVKRTGLPNGWCRECESAARRAYRQRNSEAMRAYDRMSYHRRKARVS